MLIFLNPAGHLRYLMYLWNNLGSASDDGGKAL